MKRMMAALKPNPKSVLQTSTRATGSGGIRRDRSQKSDVGGLRTAAKTGCADLVAAAILAAVEGWRLAAQSWPAVYSEPRDCSARSPAGRDATALRQAGRPTLLWLRLCAFGSLR